MVMGYTSVPSTSYDKIEAIVIFWINKTFPGKLALWEVDRLW